MKKLMGVLALSAAALVVVVLMVARTDRKVTCDAQPFLAEDGYVCTVCDMAGSHR